MKLPVTLLICQNLTTTKPDLTITIIHIASSKQTKKYQKQQEMHKISGDGKREENRS